MARFVIFYIEANMKGFINLHSLRVVPTVFFGEKVLSRMQVHPQVWEDYPCQFNLFIRVLLRIKEMNCLF